MIRIADYPLIVFAISFVALWLSAWIRRAPLRRQHVLEAKLREDFGFTLSATLTLLGPIIGFSFAIATTRYVRRQNYQEADANAIGTEPARRLVASIRPRSRAILAEELSRPADAFLRGA